MPKLAELDNERRQVVSCERTITARHTAGRKRYLEGEKHMDRCLSARTSRIKTLEYADKLRGTLRPLNLGE